MIRLFTSRRARWALPVVVGGAMAAAALTTTGGAGASERPTLPPKSAAQLLAAVQHAHPKALSGTIVETANLGLPSLPVQDTGGGGVSLQTLLTGSHTMRIWYDGPARQRLALLAPMSERDVVHNGNDLWTYTSTTNEVTHATVGRTMPHSGAPDQLGLTPQQAAQQALRAVDPSTKVAVDPTARVAGRAAYQLELVPKDSRSLVSSVRIAIDAQTSVPLRVQIFGAGTTPALQVGFTDISYGVPSPSVFNFVPPSGATVTQQGALTGPQGGESTHHQSRAGGQSAAAHPSLLGSGWTAVLKYPTGPKSSALPSGLLDKLTTTVPQGQLIKTSLLSVLVTHNGDVYVGPVSGADIQQVAATGHGL